MCARQQFCKFQVKNELSQKEVFEGEWPEHEVGIELEVLHRSELKHHGENKHMPVRA